MVTPAAPFPVLIVACTVADARFTTETFELPELPMYAFEPSGVMATPHGAVPTTTVVTVEAAPAGITGMVASAAQESATQESDL
jgi:hypothetical protein